MFQRSSIQNSKWSLFNVLMYLQSFNINVCHLLRFLCKWRPFVNIWFIDTVLITNIHRYHMVLYIFFQFSPTFVCLSAIYEYVCIRCGFYDYRVTGFYWGHLKVMSRIGDHIPNTNSVEMHLTELYISDNVVSWNFQSGYPFYCWICFVLQSIAHLRETVRINFSQYFVVKKYTLFIPNSNPFAFPTQEMKP